MYLDAVEVTSFRGDKMRFALFSVLFGAFIAFNGQAQAKTYNIDGFLDYSANGFGSSMFHAQDRSRMCCSTVADYGAMHAGGTWDSVTGDVSFGFDVVNGGTASVTGKLFQSALVSTARTSMIGYDGIFGHLTMTFTNAYYFGSQTLTFYFEDMFFNNKEPNGTNWEHVSLWGDLRPNGANSACSPNPDYCVGTDIRLAISEVPLPGSAVLLLGGLIGLGATRATKAQRKS